MSNVLICVNYYALVMVLALEPFSNWPVSFDRPSSSPNLSYISIATSMRRELANRDNTCLVYQTVSLSGLYG
jgi:hypothetical protein